MMNFAHSIDVHRIWPRWCAFGERCLHDAHDNWFKPCTPVGETTIPPQRNSHREMPFARWGGEVLIDGRGVPRVLLVTTWANHMYCSTRAPRERRGARGVHRLRTEARARGLRRQTLARTTITQKGKATYMQVRRPGRRHPGNRQLPPRRCLRCTPRAVDLFARGSRKYTDDELRRSSPRTTGPSFVAVNEDAKPARLRDILRGGAPHALKQPSSPLHPSAIDDICAWTRGRARSRRGKLRLPVNIIGFRTRGWVPQRDFSTWSAPGARKFYEAIRHGHPEDWAWSRCCNDSWPRVAWPETRRWVTHRVCPVKFSMPAPSSKCSHNAQGQCGRRDHR